MEVKLLNVPVCSEANTPINQMGEAQRYGQRLAECVGTGWRILSAAGTRGIIQYVLIKETE